MKNIETEVVVIGSGPGGYAAAFYAADRGKKVVLVEKDTHLGGVCLNRGCIPSKALLHASKVVRESAKSKIRGIHYAAPKINLSELKAWKDAILDKLSKSVASLAKSRQVQVLNGRGYFEDAKTLRVETSEGQQFVKFEKAIIAVGSKPALPGVFDLGNKRIMTSTEALQMDEVPERLLVVGGGYIGLELGTVYSTFGSKVVLVEALPSILPGVDADLVRHVSTFIKDHFEEIRLNTKVLKMATKGKQIQVTFGMEDGKEKVELYDKVLVAIGRASNMEDLGLENTKVKVSEKGFIEVNEQQQTTEPAIYAIGDATGGMLLAHKAVKEARVAVEVITGEPSVFESVIPAVVFTDPEIAWCGLSEKDAQDRGIEVKIVKFPWSASGRALTLDRADGLTKLVVDPETERILGVGITGYGAGELISEGVLAIEMGATVRDLAESVHPHPTLSETLMECAENYYGHATHALPRIQPGND